ncbi:MAG TPA: CDP-glycerol glycerophosphotransferase family protein [Pseudolysinimonas sp.]|jgi:CDP-glycerol glycerophosphotransferase (TagB/SpsB family)|nr:CDP-glycerol glycerophosphotransferase family protein [Pseudolysinimonas sp.]
MASFTFGAGNAAKLLRIPLYALGALATLVIPRSRTLWVFGSGIGVGEGALALYRTARERLGDEVRLVWLASTDAELATARTLGLEARRKFGWGGFLLTARARVLVVTHGFGDVNRFATRGGFVVQLWHGIPLKRLHLDSPAALRVSFLPDHRLVRALVARAYRFAGGGIGLFPVASELVAPRIASAFGVPRDRIVVTGDPRDDSLLAGTHPDRSGPRRILYAPTWRDGHPDPSAPSSAEWDTIAAWLEAHDAELWVRTHPLGKGDYAAGPAHSPRVRMWGPDVVVDVTPELAGFDALITDYSSIAFDYALVGGPIVFLAPDVESYAKSRGLYESYRSFSGGRHVTTWEHALAVLDRRLGETSPGPHETWLRREHFDFVDAGAAGRVLSEVLARTGAGSAAPGTARPLPRPRVTALALGERDGIPMLTVNIDAPLDGATLDGARARVDGVPHDGAVDFPLLTRRWGADGLALPSGDYRITLGDGSTRLDVGVDLPSRLEHALFHAEASAEAGGLRLRITAPLAADERGARAQKRLERAYRRAGAAAEDAVFLESFYGQSASDNPLGIDRVLATERPSTVRYWSVVDGSVAIPDGGRRIIEGSREWWRVRGSARVLIVNDWLRKRYRRRAGQHVLQTWHGTMLKRLALDRDPGIRTRIAVRREAARWDALLAQNEYSARIFRSAYAMTDPIWQDGYPRNDVLQAPDAERAARRDEVRAAVGVPAGVRVVLYAPTWRDDRTEMVDYVDLTTFAAELGEDHVLLVRGHSRTLRYGQDLAGDRLVDVTSYPSMTDLLLLADVLVTDYSSVMFDFAGTGKPIVFFTPDLAHYSADLRGFYFDLLAEAPGPVVHDRDGLRDAILGTQAADGGRDAAAAARAEAWRVRFTPFDDGRAGERVVRRMLDAGWL